jgi:hypothetical protein
MFAYLVYYLKKCQRRYSAKSDFYTNFVWTINESQWFSKKYKCKKPAFPLNNIIEDQSNKTVIYVIYSICDLNIIYIYYEYF